MTVPHFCILFGLKELHVRDLLKEIWRLFSKYWYFIVLFKVLLPYSNLIFSPHFPVIFLIHFILLYLFYCSSIAHWMRIFIMKIAVFWDVRLCHLLQVYQHFRRTGWRQQDPLEHKYSCTRPESVTSQNATVVIEVCVSVCVILFER